MTLIKSLVSDDIQIDFDDDSYPDRAKVSADGYSYTVYGAEKCMTLGEHQALKKVARPNEISDGATVRLATVHDRVLASNYGFDGARSYFLRVLDAPNGNDIVTKGNYFELDMLGRGTEMETQEPCDPEFNAIWFDAADVTDHGLEHGQVFVKGFVEATDARYDAPTEFIFVANELADTSNRALLVDRVWSIDGAISLTNFSTNEISGMRLPKENGWNLRNMASHAPEIAIDMTEILDTYRLHYQKSVRMECLEELFVEAHKKAAALRVPDFLIEQALERRLELTQSMSMSI